MRLKRRCAAILCAAGLWISSGALAAISPTTGRQIAEGRFLPVLVSVGNEYGAARAGGRRVKAAGMGDRALWGAQDADIFYESMHTCRSAGKGEAGTRWTLLFSDALARDGRVRCGPARSLREPSASLREEWQGALVYLSRMPQQYMGDACERLRADSRAAFDLRDMNRLALGGRLKGVKAPGNYGVDYIKGAMGIDPATAVMTSNFIGDALEMCRELDFRGVLLIGHIGKLVKLAGGMWNTHSRYGDCRMDILTACAAAEGLHGGAAAEMLCCATCDDALRLLKEQGLYDAVLHRLAGRIDDMMHYKCSDIETGAILFSKEYGYLCETKGASKLLRRIKED